MVCIWDVYNINNIFVFFIFFFNFETFIKNITVLMQYMSTNPVYFSKIQKLPKSKRKPNIKIIHFLIKINHSSSLSSSLSSLSLEVSLAAFREQCRNHVDILPSIVCLSNKLG
jgi:hypothetical protein